jgi:hypothetical protein
LANWSTSCSGACATAAASTAGRRPAFRRNARLYVRGTAYPVTGAWRVLIRIAEADTSAAAAAHFILELSDETIEFQGRAIPIRIERALLAAEFASLDAATATKLSEVATRLAAAPA